VRDLTIELENRPGALATMGEALGRAGVSIEGGGVFVHNGTGVAHFLFAAASEPCQVRSSQSKPYAALTSSIGVAGKKYRYST